MSLEREFTNTIAQDCHLKLSDFVFEVDIDGELVLHLFLLIKDALKSQTLSTQTREDYRLLHETFRDILISATPEIERLLGDEIDKERFEITACFCDLDMERKRFLFSNKLAIDSLIMVIAEGYRQDVNALRKSVAKAAHDAASYVSSKAIEDYIGFLEATGKDRL